MIAGTRPRVVVGRAIVGYVLFALIHLAPARIGFGSWDAEIRMARAYWGPEKFDCLAFNDRTPWVDAALFFWIPYWVVLGLGRARLVGRRARWVGYAAIEMVALLVALGVAAISNWVIAPCPYVFGTEDTSRVVLVALTVAIAAFASAVGGSIDWVLHKVFGEGTETPSRPPRGGPPSRAAIRGVGVAAVVAMLVMVASFARLQRGHAFVRPVHAFALLIVMFAAYFAVRGASQMRRAGLFDGIVCADPEGQAAARGALASFIAALGLALVAIGLLSIVPAGVPAEHAVSFRGAADFSERFQLVCLDSIAARVASST